MNIEKLKATLNCIKDSETILNGEYYVIHSDFIFSLEEEINNIKNTDIIIKVENIEEVKNKIEKLNDIIEKAKEYITKNFTNQDGTIWHSEMQDIYNILNNKDN